MKVVITDTAKRSKWQVWYAWYPITFHEDGIKWLIWLEKVERKTISEGFTLDGWLLSFSTRRKYRLLGDNNGN